MKAFAVERELDILLVMAAFYEGAAGTTTFRRQLALGWARDGGTADARAVGLLEALEASPELDLADVSEGAGWPPGCRVYDQRNLKATRKKVAPAMLKHFDDLLAAA